MELSKNQKNLIFLYSVPFLIQTVILLYQCHLDQKPVSHIMVAIYVISTLISYTTFYTIASE
jgi:hypothetical protein